MPISRHKQIADRLVEWIDESGLLLTGVTVERVDHALHVLTEMPDDEVGKVFVLPLEVTTERIDRSSDVDTCVIAIVIVGKLADTAAATVDPWDLMAEQIHDELRRCRRIRLTGGEEASRVDSHLAGLQDSELLHQSEIFVAAIEMTYRVQVQIGSELDPEGP